MSLEVGNLIERARAQSAAIAGAAEPSAAAASQRQQLEHIAQEFESMLLVQVLKDMRKASEVDEEAKDEGFGNQNFSESIDVELASHLSKAQGLGLSKQLLQAFDRMVGAAPAASPAAGGLKMLEVSAAPGPTRVAAAGSADAAAAPVVPFQDPSTDPAGLVENAVAHGGSGSEPPAPGIGTGGAGSVQPVSGRVTSAFGWRSDPFTGHSKFHKGIDLRAAYGENVQAARAGTVVFSGEQRGYGMTVVIEHANGTRSRYAHLSALTMPEGSEVEAGQVVGRAGKSGRATGTHLHFEVTGSDGRPMSPEQWARS